MAATCILLRIGMWAVGLMMLASAANAAPLEQAVSFHGDGGVKIAGTLALPPSADVSRPAPAVLLIQGSGPTDRDGNQLPGLRTDLLRQLAHVMADAGIASLRADKRGMHANRDSLPAKVDELAAFFTWPATTGDARAAFDFLGAHPAVAAGRVGMLGHSEGGLIALDSAASDRTPKVLVLASTPGRPSGEVIHDQLTALLQRQGADAEQRRFFLEADRRIRDEIGATGRVPADVPPGLAALYPGYLGPFLKSVLGLDPLQLAEKFKGPILVINGDADTQVLAGRDGARFQSALASRRDGSEVFIPPGVSHNLKIVTGADDPGLTGDIDAGVRATLLRWLKAKL
jgi:fermentation-respiration switch protein FrsA (DUF1100 family)